MEWVVNGIPGDVQWSLKMPSTASSEGSSDRAGEGQKKPRVHGWPAGCPGGLLRQPPEAASSGELGDSDAGIFK